MLNKIGNTMKKEVDGSVLSLKERDLMEKEQAGRLRALYVAPITTRTVVETEGCFCASEPITEDPASDEKAVEVDEYISIENNDITFD